MGRNGEIENMEIMKKSRRIKEKKSTEGHLEHTSAGVLASSRIH